ncbi:UBP-type zinc finger domain-containing protein [Nocardia sp. NPDC050712]|uniref:UBP-type zinc finger domain-containing protein n=1 Tax=Nocardia sp. NPDC050712 TaxID=3155518 RepID=UPI0033E3D805
MSEAIEGIDPTAAPSGPGCVECEADQGWWVHLRRCAQCGHIGCCDSSPAQHASKHATQGGHPFIQSYEPGEDWFWNYETEEMYGDGPELAAPHSHPADQGVPGPRGRVPADWQSHVH